MRKRFIVSLTIVLVIIGLFPRRGEGINDGVYYIGFPDTFLTVYTRDFLYRAGSDSRFMFSFNLLQFIVNMLAIWGLLALICKAYDVIRKRKKQAGCHH
ncbi:MAG: hypothetical protein FWC73_06215 [Defluviitaleaceae bacterium]|nr:hypothetical protein [Defluviitaleaceae bacterium]